MKSARRRTLFGRFLTCLALLPGAVAAQPVAGTPGLALPEALARARTQNETAGIAAARRDRAAAVLGEAYSTLIPALTLTGTFTRRSREVTREVNGEELTIQAKNAAQGQAVVETPLFDLRALPLVRSARHGLRAQEADSSELLRQLDFDVARSFYAVLTAERVRDAAARRLRVAEDTVEDARIRRDAGLAATNDVTRSELELATARLSHTQAAATVRTTRLALGYLLDEVVAGPLVEPDEARSVAGLDVGADGMVRLEDGATDLENIAVENRADLRAVRERAEAARLRAWGVRLGFVPRFDLRGTWRQTNEAGLSGNERDWNIAATMTWELFDGGTRASQARQRDADWRETDLVAQALERTVGVEVRRALADLETAGASLAQAQTQLDVAVQNALEVRERFSNGLATGLENADAAVAEFEAETGRERQRFALRLSELALRDALGRGPLDAEVQTP